MCNIFLFPLVIEIFFYISEVDRPGPSSGFSVLDLADDKRNQNSINAFNKESPVSANVRVKRFWMNGLWPMYRQNYIRWQPVNKKLDQYRFMMKGLGKRNDNIVSALEGQGESDENEQSISDLKDFILLTKAYDDILENSDKRTPEIYSQKLYPIQGGTQRMEVEMDRKLDSLMDDDVTQNNDYVDDFIDLPDGDIDDVDEVIPATRDTGFKTTKNYLINKRNNPWLGDDDNFINQKTKRWWAARRLQLYGLKTPKSTRESRYGRGHMDPVLYLIGLGR